MIAVNRELQTPPRAVPRLTLSEHEAAEALGISERTLLTMRQAGEVPHVKLRGRVLYTVSALQRWLDERTITAEE